ncbi:hypothetical protein D7D25_05240 [Proteiniphilum sp. X52]|nr:hypothetical protein D7D25_05240 [Proteiniphilum sp. X52]
MEVLPLNQGFVFEHPEYRRKPSLLRFHIRMFPIDFIMEDAKIYPLCHNFPRYGIQYSMFISPFAFRIDLFYGFPRGMR